jgi:hypothetical protein
MLLMVMVMVCSLERLEADMSVVWAEVDGFQTSVCHLRNHADPISTGMIIWAHRAGQFGVWGSWLAVCSSTGRGVSTTKRGSRGPRHQRGASWSEPPLAWNIRSHWCWDQHRGVVTLSLALFAASASIWSSKIGYLRLLCKASLADDQLAGRVWRSSSPTLTDENTWSQPTGFAKARGAPWTTMRVGSLPQVQTGVVFVKEIPAARNEMRCDPGSPGGGRTP